MFNWGTVYLSAQHLSKDICTLALIPPRLMNTETLVAYVCAQVRSKCASQRARFRFVGKWGSSQVEQGEKKRATFDWIVSRCADGRARTAPREVIHLLNSLREQELARLEHGGSIAPDDTLFDRSVFKAAFISKLEGQKTEQTLESLQAIWETSALEVDRTVQRLVDIGFFQRKTSRQEDTFWVPFLHRDALRMSQRLADDF
jgi:hypothetical protein